MTALGITYMVTVQWQQISGLATTMWMDPNEWQQILGLEITTLAGMAAGFRDMERHSGSQIIMAGGIGTVTEDIPEMDGSRLMVSGICLMDLVIC